MKKMFLFCTICLIFTLSACGGEEANDDSKLGDNTQDVDENDDASNGETLESVKTTLVSAGYSLSQRDADGMAYFQENIINTPYGLSVTVTDLYVGYVDGSRWMELVELSSESEANAYAEALANAGEGHLIYQNGNVVMYTFSEETSALFE
jgi:hypothetical protein